MHQQLLHNPSQQQVACSVAQQPLLHNLSQQQGECSVAQQQLLQWVPSQQPPECSELQKHRHKVVYQLKQVQAYLEIVALLLLILQSEEHNLKQIYLVVQALVRNQLTPLKQICLAMLVLARNLPMLLKQIYLEVQVLSHNHKKKAKFNLSKPPLPSHLVAMTKNINNGAIISEKKL